MVCLQTYLCVMPVMTFNLNFRTMDKFKIIVFHISLHALKFIILDY